MSEVSTAIDRERRSRPGRDQTSPQAYAGDEVLPVGGHSVAAAVDAVDVRVAQHFAPRHHALRRSALRR